MKISGCNCNADNHTYCNCWLLKGNSTFQEIISSRDTSHWKIAFYLDLFGPGPDGISIHKDLKISLLFIVNVTFQTHTVIGDLEHFKHGFSERI